MAFEIIEVGDKTFLEIDGNLYYRHSKNPKNQKIQYWRCQMCDTRATTEENDELVLKKGRVKC